MMVSHETTDGAAHLGPARRGGPAHRRRPEHPHGAHLRARGVHHGVRRAGFVRIGARNVVRAPLGVDLAGRHPALRDPGLRARHARVDETLLVMCSRLSVEKRPGTALDALAALLRRGERAVLVVAGDGPLRPRLEQRARSAGCR